MNAFMTFNLLIAFGIMKCMKALLIILATANSISMGSCSKDSQLTAALPKHVEKNDSRKVETTNQENDSSENNQESEEPIKEDQEQTTGSKDPIDEDQEQTTGSEQQTDEEEGQPQQVQEPRLIDEIQIFPENHPLNKTISLRAVDKNSTAILTNIGNEISIFADFGSGAWKGEPIGIPFAIVGKNQPKVPITFRSNATDGNYGHESEKGPFPIPLDAPVEAKFASDGHVITVDTDSGMLYELYNAEQSGEGWTASSAAVFDLNSMEMRPDGWTSADAAGLPIFPLLIRYEEIQTGEIDHPIRFVLERANIYEGYVHPARHLISGQTNSNLLPMGGRLRLKADFDISSYSGTNQVILKAMKKYGLILADVGMNMYLKGAPNENWDNMDLKELKKVKVSDFEVVELGEIQTRD